jgi:RNA polymerase sigma-70 factor, ECF subfamily
MPHSDERDIELMHLAAVGDRGAFEEIVERHAPSMYRFASAIASSSAAAEDAMQDAFLGAWRGAKSFRADASVRNWLIRILRNAVYRQHRLRADEPADTEPLSELGAAAGWGDPEAAVLGRESREVLARAMDQLGSADREILLLREIEDLPGAEVASILGLSLAAMKTRLHRARLRLAAKVRSVYEHAS